MAIKGNNKKRKEAIDQESFHGSRVIGNVHHQPPAFRPTGLPAVTRLNDFPATATNSNVSLTNKATAPSNGYLYKIHLFVNAVQTGWTLSGEYGQGKLGRVFYPRNLSQDELLIEGVTANNYEYDRLVSFVEHHHNTQFTSRLAIRRAFEGDTIYPGVDFMLHRPTGGQTFDAFRPLFYTVVITDITAGAERFMYAREYTLQCKVINDYLSKRGIEEDINRQIRRTRVYGSAQEPGMRTGNEGLSSPSTQTKTK